MKLSNFIQETLYEIALGIELGKARSKDFVAINPSRLDGELVTEKSYIDFDVSVVVNEVEDKAAKGGGRMGGEIQVASVGKISAELGGEKRASSNTALQQTHRVTFKVPLYMNASYRDNSAAAAAAVEILKKHNLEK